MSNIAVAGAGLTGCLLAVRLAEAGHTVDVFDRRPDLRVHDVDAGRSINLALSTRGLDALAQIGLHHVVLEEAIAMPGRIIHGNDGSTTFQPYGTEPHHQLHSVNRDTLNIALLDAVDATSGVTCHFGHRVRDLSVRRRELTIEHDGTTGTRTFDVVFGADGAYSAVRGRLQRVGRVDFSQSFLEHGYKELTIPVGPDGPALDPNALHIWPRGSHMMIALANPDGSFTGTLFWPFDGVPGLDALTTAEAIERTFDDEYGDVRALIPDLVDQYLTNPSSSLVTMRTGPWHHKGNALILGDAAHAVVPFLGQGANAALEDVTLLMDIYDTHGPEAHEKVFDTFYAQRKPDADALADLAIEHYDEMRAGIASRAFLLGKWLERTLTNVLPSFVPLYTLISFTRTPYAEAVARAERQHHRLRVAGIGLLVVVVAIALLVVSLTV